MPPASGRTSPPDDLTFHYTDSALARVIHVDGIWGGTAGAGIHMAVFSQHHPIPETVTYELESPGRLGKEKSRIQADGLVRTIEAHLMMNLETAVAIRNWLDDRIRQLEEIQQQARGD